ncbi:MAG TPA: hypothetical protein VG407_12940 [Caulobacteraceae bacterium]|nr:hypothetical protein [Caulobacteraceae bacterium]
MTRFLASAAPAVLIAALAASSALADVPQDRFQALHWRSIGPFRGGRVLAVTGVPGEPEHFYFGAVNGGVWETINAGRTWAPISDSVPNGSVGALAVAPSNPKVLYLGTGEADMRSDIAQGIGAFKSTDGGKSWSPIGLKDSQAIGRILVDPRNPDVVLAAVLGHPYGPNPERGVYRSEDGGKTWTSVLNKGPDIGAIDMTFKPGDPNTVYASMWHTRRPPWNVYPPALGKGGGLYKSSDGGKTWTALGGGLPAVPGHIGVALSASKPDRVYALVDAKDGGGLYRSDDDGATFAKVSSDPRVWERGWYFGGITVDPKNPDRVWVCDVSVYESDDAGKTFVPVKGAPGGDDYHVMWVDPDHPERRMLGVDQGAVITLDNGATWSSWYNEPIAQMYHVVTDNRTPYWVYGAQQDSGAAGVPSRTGSLDGIDMRVFKEVTAGGESDEIAPDPNDPDIVYGGRVDKLDLKTGQTKSVDPTLDYPDHYRRTWTLPLVFSKRDPKQLYFGNQRIFRTEDGGNHWTPISPDLTREKPGVPPTADEATAIDSDNAFQSRKGVVYSIAPSPTRAGDIWAGTDDGLVWKTQDDGQHWANVTPKALTAWSKVGTVELSPFDDDEAYIAVDRHRLDDFTPHLYRTRDGGKSWTSIVEGLVGDGPINTVNVVREDVRQKGLLYAGTERGAFVSFDDGDHWQPLDRNGLPPTSVRDIEVKGDDLVIATHGRGFYIMDDIEPLRELAQGQVSATTLFAPATAYRLRPFGFTGTPMPKDEPHADNPPDGGYIDYYLPGAAKGPVRIVIRDANGAMVRRYSSADPVPAPDVSKLRLTPDWAVPPPAPSAAGGMHRFVWDLHYAVSAGADAQDEDGLETKGVWAPPGRYTVELTVDGETLRQPLTLQPDPRVKDTPQMYAAEFALARRIEADTAKAGRGVATAEALHKKLEAAATGASKGERAKIEAADREVMAAGGIRGNDGKAELAGTTNLSDVSGALRALGRAADGADGGPTADAEAGVKTQEDALAASLSALDAANARANAVLSAPAGVAKKKRR